MQLRDAPGMDTRSEPVMILEASGHRIAVAARAVPGMGPVGAADLGCGSSYRDHWAVEPTGIAGLLLGKAQGSRNAQFNNCNKQCLHS